MSKENQIILFKSTNNTGLLEAILKQANKDEKVVLLANKKSSFFKDSLEQLRENLVTFDTLYTHVRCMFLRNNLNELNEKYGELSFISEIENISKYEDFSTLCFYRLDTLLDCVSKQECEIIIAEIIKIAYHFDKKVIFSINNNTELGELLESILSDLVDSQHQIDDNKSINQKQLVLLNSNNNTKLIKSAINLHKQGKNFLFLGNNETIFLRDSFKVLQKEMTDFDKFYTHMKCMFLKDDWSILDDMYGKPFFIYEIEKLMKNRNFSTIYFHRLDKLFAGSSFESCEQLIMDIKDFARYYHKQIIFSIDTNTELGEILKSILQDIVDYEYILEESCDNCIKKSIQQPANTIFHQPFESKNKRIHL